jgi:hypothetical protein
MIEVCSSWMKPGASRYCAFANLFGVTIDLRGRTLLEVLRASSGYLLEKVETEKQVHGYELKVGGLHERWLEISTPPSSAAITNRGRHPGVS